MAFGQIKNSLELNNEKQIQNIKNINNSNHFRISAEFFVEKIQ